MTFVIITKLLQIVAALVFSVTSCLLNLHSSLTIRGYKNFLFTSFSFLCAGMSD